MRSTISMPMSFDIGRLVHPFGRGETIGSVLARSRGVGPGFDLLRIGLATLIFVGHARWVSGGHALVPPGGATVVDLSGSGHWLSLGRFKILLLPMFFALSGILIMGSALRLRATSTFVMHRVLRIFPALVVEILLSAFLLGPLLTSLPLGDYFAGHAFYRYLANCLGIVSFELPGLFTTNPVPVIVNMNLWTLPSELDCYVIATLLMVTGVLFNRKVLTILFVTATVYAAVFDLATGMVVKQNLYDSHILTYYFCTGVLIYHWRDRIPVRTDLALACAIFGLLGVASDSLTYLSPVFVTLTVVYIGILPFRRIPILSGGDYSYGIYLYGFPISQAVVHIFPGLRSHPYETLGLAGSITLIFAMVSWHLVEKRVLALRRHLPTAWFPTPRHEPRAAAASR